MAQFSATPSPTFDVYRFSEDAVFSCIYTSYSSVLHTHEDFYEFSLVTYGEFINEYLGEKKLLQKNSLIFFKAGESHAIYSNKPGSIHCSFIVKAPFFENLFSQLFPSDHLKTLKKYEERLLSPVQAEYLANLINQILDNSSRNQRERLMHLFVYTVLSFFLMEPSASSSQSSTDQYVDDLLMRLNNLVYLKHKVHEIYSDYPISPSILITKFKAKTGYTIVQYHTMKKLDHAAQLLASSRLTVTEVCFMLQFSSLSHFSKIFKEHFHMTPKEYQRYHAVYQVPNENRIGLS